MDWMQIWQEAGLLIILGVVLLVAGVFRLLKSRREKKLDKSIKELGLEYKASKDLEKKAEKPVFDYESLLEGEEVSEKENIIEQINSLNKKLKKESNENEKRIKEESDKLQTELKELLKNKQKLLEYGKEMSALFKSYEHREKQLGLTVVALERVLKEDKNE